MKPFWHDDHLTLYGGDCRAVLAELPAESAHCVVTSPPYWGLRDYGTATWEGGDAGCAHRVPATGSTQNKGNNNREGAPFRERCERCGAARVDRQLGLEPTPEEYVANMVAVFREVRRVLRADGTLWLNLGDSYATGAGKASSPGGGAQGKRFMDAGPSGYRGGHDMSPKHSMPQTPDGKNPGAMIPTFQPNRMPIAGLKPKDLVGIPWRVAFALQADGWYLRSDIIWSKPNPMPESVTDRPTKAHEYLFLLTKSARYYFDADAVREPSTGRTDVGKMSFRAEIGAGGVWRDEERTGDVSVRNLRSVWTIATEPYPGAHFATFPRKLVEPCVKAGTSERGVCPECGAPWERVVEREAERTPVTARTPKAVAREQGRGEYPPNSTETGGVAGVVRLTTTGWRPSCAHDAEPVPAAVLDPFAGSGTTLLVAQSLGRRGVGIDLNPEYLQQALARNAQTPLWLVR